MSTDAAQLAPAAWGQTAPAADLLSVGPESTDVIPRLWGERMLTELRSSKPALWRSLLGKASTGG